MAIKERLTDKAGPLPVWGWAAILVGAFVVISYVRSKKKAASTDPNADPNAPSDTATDEADTIPASLAAEMNAEYTLSNNLGLASSGIANLATNVGANTTATVNNTGAVNSNTGAEKQNTSATVGNTAATNLNTKTIKASKPVHQRPGPTHKPPSSSKSRTYTVKAGDTLSAIASRFKVKGGWQALYQHNKKTVGSNPNLIRPGERLVIP